jgi:hypothetical protein
MINNLVVNGCSYMETYVGGSGHIDLATRLNIAHSHSLALGGSANSRIIRTTLKHSYIVEQPTLYVLGMTFVSRREIPILNPVDGQEFEGMWTNPQNQDFESQWQAHWSRADTDLYVKLKLKWEWMSVADRIEDLMYRIVSMGHDLIGRGHRVLVFQQADDLHLEIFDHPRFDLFRKQSWIIDYTWRSIVWQHNQGVPGTGEQAPETIRHRHPQHYHRLNEFLTDYIRTHDIL